MKENNTGEQPDQALPQGAVMGCKKGAAVGVFKIKLTRGKFAIVDEDIFKEYGHLKWHVKFSKGKYCARRNYNIYLHYIVMGRPPLKNEETIFINNNSLDCRRCNLSYVPKREKTSKYRGVSRVFIARIEYNNEYFIEHFSDEKDAANWYNKKAKEFFGEKAKLNVI